MKLLKYSLGLGLLFLSPASIRAVDIVKQVYGSASPNLNCIWTDVTDKVAAGVSVNSAGLGVDPCFGAVKQLILVPSGQVYDPSRNGIVEGGVIASTTIRNVLGTKFLSDGTPLFKAYYGPLPKNHPLQVAGAPTANAVDITPTSKALSKATNSINNALIGFDPQPYSSKMLTNYNSDGTYNLIVEGANFTSIAGQKAAQDAYNWSAGIGNPGSISNAVKEAVLNNLPSACGLLKSGKDCSNANQCRDKCRSRLDINTACHASDWSAGHGCECFYGQSVDNTCNNWEGTGAYNK